MQIRSGGRRGIHARARDRCVARCALWLLTRDTNAAPFLWWPSPGQIHNPEATPAFFSEQRPQYIRQMLGCFNPTLGQIWTNKHWDKNAIKKLTQWLGLSIFDPKLG